MANRPQTLYALADSPVGLAAWMLDHDVASYELIARVFAGQSEGLTRDDILDNVTLYWLTNTAVSSARLYWESKLAFFAPKGVTIPTAVSVFPDEIYAAPKSWTEKAYPNLIHYNRLPKGGALRRLGAAAGPIAKNCARASARCASGHGGMTAPTRCRPSLRSSKLNATVPRAKETPWIPRRSSCARKGPYCSRR